jgi:hypothetical protein
MSLRFVQSKIASATSATGFAVGSRRFPDLFDGPLKCREAGVGLDLPDSRIQSHLRNDYFRPGNWWVRILHS